MSLEEVISHDTPVDDPTWFQYYRYSFGLPQPQDDQDEDMNDSEHSFSSSCCNLEEEDVPTYVALCAYNLAVTQHEIGLLNGSVRHLAQALSFYQTALTHLDNKNNNNNNDNNKNYNDDTHAWLKLAAQNNLGHIYSFLGDCSGVLQCQQAMKDRLSVFPATSWGWFRASLARASLLWTHQAAAA